MDDTMKNEQDISEGIKLGDGLDFTIDDVFDSSLLYFDWSI